MRCIILKRLHLRWDLNMKRSGRDMFQVEEILCRGCDWGAWAWYGGDAGRPVWQCRVRVVDDVVKGRLVLNCVGPCRYSKFWMWSKCIGEPLEGIKKRDGLNRFTLWKVHFGYWLENGHQENKIGSKRSVSWEVSDMMSLGLKGEKSFLVIWSKYPFL